MIFLVIFPQTHHMIKNRIYLFGDSITYGQLVSSHYTWATTLAKKLDEYSSDDLVFTIQNTGVNGNTTRQALERLQYDVTSHNPDFVSVQFGMNDCNHWETDFIHPRVSRMAFAANLEEIVLKVLASGAKICFIGTNHPSNKGPFKHIDSITYDESNTAYNELIRMVYRKLKKDKLPVTLIDNELNWMVYLSKHEQVSLTDLLLEDGIHLSHKGHELYIDYSVDIMVSEIITQLKK